VKITHLKDEDPRIWKEFWNFFQHSRPYDLGCIRSPHLKRKKIESLFDFYCDQCEVYFTEVNEKIQSVIFLTPYSSWLDVTFLFGVSRDFKGSDLIRGAHAIFDTALQDHNKNYLKSEIRRKHKVEAYIKWVERYDKRAIIFNDPPNTVVWCKSNRMNAKFKVVGTNQSTNHLIGKEASLTQSYQKKEHGLLRELMIEDKKYLLDEKSVDFLPSFVLIHGLLSDDKENVGRVALEFTPQNEK
tara:strand:- start:336 stop:1061 length:726 start_codon:yes stop_codon:yes gene_type:complete